MTQTEKATLNDLIDAAGEIAALREIERRLSETGDAVTLEARDNVTEAIELLKVRDE